MQPSFVSFHLMLTVRYLVGPLFLEVKVERHDDASINCNLALELCCLSFPRQSVVLKMVCVNLILVKYYCF